MSNSMISAATLRAYRETEYRVESAWPLVLRIDQYSPALAQLYRARAVESGVFVTACNPRGHLLESRINDRRQASLHRFLSTQGWLFANGVGHRPGGDWPAESSFFVLGVSRTQAQSLGRQFEQNAIVWCGRDAIPQLLLLY